MKMETMLAFKGGLTMGDLFDNYRIIEEAKERAINRGSSVTEFKSYDRVTKIERRSGVEGYAAGFSDYHG